MDALLPAETTDLIDAERAALNRLKQLLERTGAEPDTVAPLDDLIDNLDEFFLVVVVGEFNAGKSSVLNALFGEKLMEEGPIPTTAKITVLRYGEEPMERQLTEYLVERRYPSELLRHLHLVDTPGTNSIIQQHQRITEDFIPRADLVLFITSYDRPLTESERRFLSFIREEWGKRLLFVLNKADLARDEASLRQVVEHIRSGCRELMDFEPRIFPVSAELAFAAKTTESQSAARTLWERSRFEALEAFMTDRLAGPERVALKLMAPLDTAEKLLGTLGTRLERRRDVLAQDEQHLAAFEEEMAEARGDLQGGYGRYVAEIDNLLLEMERRGVQFLDDTIRASFPKIQLLRDRDRFKEAFEREVVRDVDRRIQDLVTEAVDDLLGRAMQRQHRTLRALADRVRAAGGDERVSERAFSYNRAEVFGEVMREAERKIEMHDMRAEARRILENARGATDLALGAGAGAAGLGVLGVALIVAPTLDALGGFGLASGAVLAVAGASILPRQRRKAITEFKARVEDLRRDMKEALVAQFDREIDASMDRVQETVTPFADFVAEERTTLEEAAAERAALADELARLRTDVRDVSGDPRIEAE